MNKVVECIHVTSFSFAICPTSFPNRNNLSQSASSRTAWLMPFHTRSHTTFHFRFISWHTQVSFPSCLMHQSIPECLFCEQRIVSRYAFLLVFLTMVGQVPRYKICHALVNYVEIFYDLRY